MSTLVIIPCGKTKIWSRQPDAGRVPAKLAYTGPAFVVNREYAELRGSPWMVLSAKYGFLSPEQEIEDYDVTFSDPMTNPIPLSELKAQARAQGLFEYAHVIVLAGEDYASRVVEVFRGTGTEVELPLAGLRYGEGLQAVKCMTLDLGKGDVPQGPPGRAEPPRMSTEDDAESRTHRSNTPKEPFAAVWGRICGLQGELFHTKSGEPFHYRVSGNSLVTDRTPYPISYSQFELAYQKMPISGPGALSKVVRGASYVWAILKDQRVVSW